MRSPIVTLVAMRGWWPTRAMDGAPAPAKSAPVTGPDVIWIVDVADPVANSIWIPPDGDPAKVHLWCDVRETGASVVVLAM